MDRSEPRARQHRDHRLRDHRHVDDDPVPAPDPAAVQDPGEERNPVAELSIRECLCCSRHAAVENEGRLLGPFVVGVTIEGVVAGVQLTAGKPAGSRLGVTVQHDVPSPGPIDVTGCFTPELVRPFQRSPIGRVERRAGHGLNLIPLQVRPLKPRSQLLPSPGVDAPMSDTRFPHAPMPASIW